MLGAVLFFALRVNSAGPTTIEFFALFPEHATVPTNFVVLIPRTSVASTDSGTWVLRRIGEQQFLATNLAFDADFVRITPAQELPDDADFEALSFPDNPDQDPIRVIPFHTSQRDERPPAKPVVKRTDSRSGSSLTDFTIFVAADPDVAGYETIEHVDGVDRLVDACLPMVDPRNNVALGGLADGGGGWTSFTVIAFDDAGNRSSVDTTIFLNPVGCRSTTGEAPTAALVLALVRWKTRSSRRFAR